MNQKYSIDAQQIATLTGKTGNLQGIISSDNVVEFLGFTRLDQGKGSSFINVLDSIVGRDGYTLIPDNHHDAQNNHADTYRIPCPRSKQAELIGVDLMISSGFENTSHDIKTVEQAFDALGIIKTLQGRKDFLQAICKETCLDDYLFELITQYRQHQNNR